MENSANIYVFDNGVKVYRHHLLEKQFERYVEINLHEPEEEKWFLKMLHAKVPPEGVFFDIGAAIGYYAILAKTILPALEIHAFEPLALHQAYLRENMYLNNINEKAITIHPTALAEKKGEAEFIENRFGSALNARHANSPQRGQNVVKTLVRRVRSEKTIAPASHPRSVVTTTTLDAVASQFKTIDLVKVDVQGFEVNVLKGAAASLRSGRIKAWIIGSHSAALHRQCLELLRANAYRIVFEQQQVLHQPDGIIIAEVG